jgi:hypothetical protein
MKLIRIFITVLLCSPVFLQAQTEVVDFSDLEQIDWEEKPEWSELEEAYQEEPEVTLIYNKMIEFAYSDKYDGRLVEYYTVHKKVRVNNDDAIEYHNKVYIGLNGVLELGDAKGRVIKPNGEIINFDTTNIQQSDGGEDMAPHYYFALDGVEIGSDVEYTYTLLKVPSVKGRRVTLQDEYERTNVDFTLIAPDNLLFEIRTYNGLTEAYRDSTREDKNVYHVHEEVIEKMPDEDYSSYERNQMYLVYKLDGNLATGKGNIVTFGEISQSIFEAYYYPLEKKEAKSIAKLVKESGADDEESIDAKLRKLDGYIKNNIYLLDVIDFSSIKDAMKYKFTSSYGLGLIYAQCMEHLGIESQIVLTTNRYENYFDEEFEHHQVLENLMFYIPKTKKYLVPDDYSFRYGIFPASWAGQKGLFIRKVGVGDIQTGVAKIKFIEGLDAELTKDVMDVTFAFDDMTEPVAMFKRELSGYSSCYFQPYYSDLDSLAREELDEAYVKFVDQEGELLEYSVSGVDKEDVFVNPVVYTGKIKTATLLEKAGNKYMFKIGEAIGPQAEMYEEKERKLDIEHDHNMIYERKISFTVPDGYKVAGLEKLEINEVYPKEDPTIGFVSSYAMEGDEVVVTVTEYYRQIQFDKTEINDFRRIINAAANFNKVVLFLEAE